jgi:hypothetical protein
MDILIVPPSRYASQPNLPAETLLFYGRQFRTEQPFHITIADTWKIDVVIFCLVEEGRYSK